MHGPDEEPGAGPVPRTPPLLLPGRTAAALRDGRERVWAAALVLLVVIVVAGPPVVAGGLGRLLPLALLAIGGYAAWREIQAARRSEEEAAAGYTTTATSRQLDRWVLDRDGHVVFEPELLREARLAGEVVAAERAAARRALGREDASNDPAAGPLSDEAMPSLPTDEMTEAIYEGLARLTGDEGREAVIFAVEGGDSRYVQFALLNDGWLVGEVVSREFLDAEHRPLLDEEVIRDLGYRDLPGPNYAQDFGPDTSLEMIAAIATSALVDGLGVAPGTSLNVTEL